MQDNPLCNREEFQRWVDHPLTAAFRQFLKDRVQTLAMQWAQAAAPSDSPAMMQAQAQAETLGDLAHLSCDDVRGFYDVEGESE